MSIKFVYLTFPCPKGCACKDRETNREWYHTQCDTRSKINRTGFISCDDGCDSYFIKDAKFQCNKAKTQGNTWYSYRTLSDFLSALSCAVESAEFNVQKDHDRNEFVKSLLKAAEEQWNK